MSEHERKVRMVRDPVCGMRFRAEKAAATVVVDGREIFFCTQACLERFQETAENNG
ncbi:MAG: YHS domain-containing protein [Gemmatimonadota bacterium]